MKSLYLTPLLALFMLAPLLMNGQMVEVATEQQGHGQTQVELSRSLSLENDSKEENIIIAVNKKMLSLDLRISARIGDGKIEIEIYSPSGKKEWNISVGKQTKSDKLEEVFGTIAKKLVDPEAGDWVVKLKPANATGIVTLNSKSFEY